MDDDLPAVLQDIARLTTPGTALRLARELGGARVWISAAPRADDPVVRAVGREAQQQIAAEFARNYLVIPLGPWSSRAQHNATLSWLIADQRPVDAIAREAHVHRRTVQRHKKRLAQQQRLPLFEGSDGEDG